MAKIISQTVTLKAQPDALFRTYLDSHRHGAVIGRKVRIGKKAGARFVAFNGIITGRNLLIVPNRVIVQAWRSRHWRKTDPDSILVLTFLRARGGGQIRLVHVNVPSHDYAGVKKGWHAYYWKPWRAYLKRSRSRNASSKGSRTR